MKALSNYCFVAFIQNACILALKMAHLCEAHALGKPVTTFPENALEKPCLGIVAGAGTLPAAIASAACAQGVSVFIVGFAGSADPSIERFPHAYIRLVEIGRLMRLLRQHGCHDVVLVGGIRRPKVLSVRLDFGVVRHFFGLLRLLKGGDDHVLRKVARLFEKEGFRLKAAHEIAPHLLAPEGVFSKIAPDEAALSDIKLGFEVVAALGAFDIGQAAVVSGGYVLGVEAAEGTDALLRRSADLNTWGFDGKRGVLVKALKPAQDERLDMPTIGPRTVELAAAAGLKGIAVAAGAVLLAEQGALVEKANKLGLFLYGVRLQERPALYEEISHLSSRHNDF